MPTALTPATLAFRDDGTPFSPMHDDVYHSAGGALAQARHVFLRGNGLPQRWQQKRLFTVLETGFGAGINFLATWAAWRADPARCERLHFVSVEKHPFRLHDLREFHRRVIPQAPLEELARQLGDAWPMPTPGVHRLEFEQGRVTLTLLFGDACQTLTELWLRADAFYLDGFSPAKNAALWSPAIFRALARVAAERATFATWSCAGDVRRALQQNGFECQKVEGFAAKRTMLVGQFAPRWRIRRYEPPQPVAAHHRHAIVIGAGMAGCALVERLAARGWDVTLIDKNAAPAQEASGNPAGVFHPLISRDDNSASRITRAGFLYALQRWRALADAGHPPARGTGGLLHLAADEDEAQTIAAAIAAAAWPEHYVHAVSREAAQQIAGVALAQGGWFYPSGGWISPASLCAAQCAAAGQRLDARFGAQASAVERRADEWFVLDASAQVIAHAPVIIFANASDAARLAGLAHAPTRIVRGQLALVPHSPVAALRVPVIGDGYALPLANDVTLAGATYDVDDTDSAWRAASHQENLMRVARMLPALQARAGEAAGLADDPAGRVAFRCVTSDRLPMLGSLPDEALCLRNAAALHGAWPRDLPRAPGAYGAFALGSRGLVWATLGAELIASQIEGEPWPLERELAERLDPARFLQRALRSSGLETAGLPPS